MYPATAPSDGDIEAARAVLKAARLARMRERRAAHRAGGEAVTPRFKVAAYLCAYCGTPFEARAFNRPTIGRWCSQSCRQLAYQARQRRRAARGAVLAAAGVR